MNILRIDIDEFENLVEPEMGREKLIKLLKECEVKQKHRKNEKVVTVTLETEPENCYIVESNKHTYFDRIYNNKSTSMFKEVAFKVIMFLMEDVHKDTILKNEIFREDS